MKSSLREITLSDYLINRQNLYEPFKSLFDCYYLTGVRVSEALMMKGVDFDFDKGTVFVHTEKNKSNPYRTVHLFAPDSRSKILLENVQEYAQRSGNHQEPVWFFEGIKFPRKEVWRQCWKIFGFTTHSFRHTHAIMLVRDIGFPMNELMSEMGWSSSKSALQYLQYENLSSRRKRMGLVDNKTSRPNLSPTEPLPDSELEQSLAFPWVLDRH